MAAIKVMLDECAYLPERAHPYDAGLDIRAPYTFTIRPGDSRTINTGVHIAIPKGYAGMIKSKSGLNVKNGITTEGVIDYGYTGAVKVKMYMAECQNEKYTFYEGDKIAQLVIVPINLDTLVKVDRLDETERGDKGFGSTGR